MGEYATRIGDNASVKIGTCESMYYLRYEDRRKVRKEPHSLDAANTMNLFWRLPFPDEDTIRIGDYKDYDRGLRLYKRGESGYADDYTNPSYAEDVGVIQLKHEASGLLVNMPCYHGEKLPELDGAKTFWNGKGHSYELAFLKNTAAGVLPVLRCRHCNKMWREAWANIWDYIEPALQAKLEQYKECKE